MKVLLRAATIYNPASAFHMQQHNVLLENGTITYIGQDEQKADTEVALEGLCISVGWIDMHAYTGEPGLEYKEDLESLSAAAAAGALQKYFACPTQIRWCKQRAPSAISKIDHSTTQ
ncbi:hypothetical protein GCM10028895_45560 [Pontibacter rugosus]